MKQEGSASGVDNAEHMQGTVKLAGNNGANMEDNVQQIELQRHSKILCRNRKDFDDDQGRFLSPWRINQSSSDTFCADEGRTNASTSASNSSESFDCCFTLQWTTSKPFSNGVWTSDATFTGMHVPGEVTLFFPCTTFIGNSTVAEIETLLTQVL